MTGLEITIPAPCDWLNSNQRLHRVVAEFSVPGEPVSKARARFTKYGSKTVTYTPEKTKTGEARMAAAFRAVCKSKPSDPEIAYRVEAHFYNGTRQRRDIDNMTKLILDGLNGVAWVDDNQVTELIARKSYGTTAQARTEVRIVEVGRLDPPKAPCVRCGTEFRTYESSSQRYCSRECLKAHRIERRERTCEQCSTAFLAQGETSDTRFCSVACNSTAKRATLTCDGCGVEFTKQRCHVRAKNYCSTECNATAARARRLTRFRGVCEACGAGVTRKEYRRCGACVRSGQRTSGKPQVTGPDMRAGEKRAEPCVVVRVEAIA